MRIETEIKMVEQKFVKYVAEDGIEFESEYECKKYEKKQILQELIKQAEKLRIKELDDQIPLFDDGLMNENNTFRWYRLESQKDFKTLNKAYGNQLEEPKNYPEIMCVETVGYEAYLDDAYSYDMTTCKTITEKFWKKFGYKVTFEKEQKKTVLIKCVEREISALGTFESQDLAHHAMEIDLAKEMGLETVPENWGMFRWMSMIILRYMLIEQV